jgi:hypothetical protein
MPRSPEYDLILEYLNFDWVTTDKMYADLYTKIMPGKAVRHYNDQYDRAAKNRSGAAPVKGRLSQNEQISSGARSILRDALWSAVQAGTVERKKVDDVTYIRRNVFDAAQIETILRSHIQDLLKSANQELAATSEPEPQPIRLYDLAYDIRSIKHLAVKSDNGTVIAMLDDVIDNQSLRLLFTPEAADFFADQLGIQALATRNGKKNNQKIIPLSTDK